MLARVALFALLILPLPMTHQAFGHALFNSAEETIGNLRVQIATDPEIPTINQKCKILFRVTDETLNLNEVPRFTMGVRIFYDDVQIDGVPPQSHEGGHWDFDYAFKKHGNHIFRVDLYDEEGKVRTYTFNVSTQSPFGYMFTYIITAGAVGLAVLFSYIYLPKNLKKLRSKF